MNQWYQEMIDDLEEKLYGFYETYLDCNDMQYQFWVTTIQAEEWYDTCVYEQPTLDSEDLALLEETKERIADHLEEKGDTQLLIVSRRFTIGTGKPEFPPLEALRSLCGILMDFDAYCVQNLPDRVCCMVSQSGPVTMTVDADLLRLD